VRESERNEDGNFEEDIYDFGESFTIHVSSWSSLLFIKHNWKEILADMGG